MRSVDRYRMIWFLAAVLACSGRDALGQAIWGLKSGDTFSVETRIERTNSISFDGGESTVTKANDLMEVRYRVAYVRPDTALINATITRYEQLDDDLTARDATSDLFALLEGLQVDLHMSDDGSIRNITGRTQALQKLAASSPDKRKLLENCCTDRVLASWLGRPFWVTPLEKELTTDSEWSHTDELSLGLLGQIRTITTCSIDTTDQNEATINISGTSRHIPLVTSSKNAFVKFTDCNVAVKDFGGTAKLIQQLPVPEENEIDINGLPPSRQRPWFEELNLKWTLTGEAAVTTGRTTRNLAFEQTRALTSKLKPGFRVGGPQYLHQRSLAP